ncbi:helix-turn-helix domain-containing protein [Granulicella sibirica]|uniref:Transcriptional regulator, MerR family n=1 Tax=Granulicella sibirica TaxID=2479048 RepID=A0A4Q0T4G4_9BACT|nr:XRE family transcriptional regulator [Granulicella sibirica]RXH56471.1 Transcriptional regulator, MerR family [Granulicella sibirica]
MDTPAIDFDEVDPNAVELILAESQIGSRIKQLRLKRSMGLVELGQATGLSASFLSQLETGRVVPTLRNLARLGLAFGKDLSYFFQPEKHSFFRIQRRKDRIRLPQPRPTNPSHIAESFGILVPDRSLGPCLAEFFPNTDTPPFQPRIYQGHEMVYMISGALDVVFGSRNERLEGGDVAFLDAETTRSFRCSGEVSATALIVSMPARSDRDVPRGGRL